MSHDTTEVPARPDPVDARAANTRRSIAVIAVLGYCGAMVSVMQTVALPLLAELPDTLDATVGDVSWIATSTLLAGAVANPALGRMGDMYGKRRILLLCLLILLGGSVLAALAGDLVTLVVGRTLQGFGVAVIPLGISIASEELPPHKVSAGIALVSATLGIGSGLGLPLGGALVDRYDWHIVFWVSTALALVGLIAAAWVIPESSVRSRGRFDVVGAIGLSLILFGFLLPVSKSPTWGWTAPLPLTLFVASAVGSVAWARYVLRRSLPVVDLRVMRRRPVMLANLTGLLLGFAMFSNFFGTISLLQLPEGVDHGFDIDLMTAGLVMAPGALAMVATSPLSARITDGFGARTTLIGGSALIGVALALRPLFTGSLIEVAIGFGAVNAGVGLTFGALPAVIMAHVPATESGSANAINALARTGGGAIASAAVAAVVGAFTITVAGELVPSPTAFTVLFLLAGALAVLAAGLAHLLPRGPAVART